MCPTSSASREAHRLSAPWGTRSTSSAWRTSSREEVGEFLEERTLDELGDIIEVLEELAHLQGWTDWEIRHARSEKAQRNGIFRERIFLEKVLED